MMASNPQKIAKNTAFLYMRMLFVMVVNIFSVRYVLKGLGVVDYGIFNVVAGLVTMFSSLGNIISSATQRFHSYVIGEGNEEKVSQVFTASIIIFSFLALLVLFAGESIGLWFINSRADIPAERLNTANWVFQLMMLSFVFGLITSSFSALIFAYEKMQVFSIISVSECTLKFLLAYSLLYLGGDHLLSYGIGLLIISSIVLGVYYYSCKRTSKYARIVKGVDKSLYKEMLSFSGWTLFSSSASIGISQLVTMITNVFFGPIVNAARGIAFQVSSALSSFTASVTVALRPPMIKSYAEGDYDLVNRYFKFCNKAVYYLLLLVLLPLFFEMEMVLHLWLDVNDPQTILFCRLILVYALVLSLNNPISIIVQATGNIKAYSTYVEIPTLLCFPVTWALYALGLPAEVAFYVMIIAITISHIIRLICLKSVFPDFSYRVYLKEFVLPAVLITAVISIALSVLSYFLVSNVLRLFITIVVCGCLVMLMCWLFGFTRKEINVLLSMIGITSH